MGDHHDGVHMKMAVDKGPAIIARLRRLYDHYRPELSWKVDDLAVKYREHLPELLAAAVRKYGAEPPAAAVVVNSHPLPARAALPGEQAVSRIETAPAGTSEPASAGRATVTVIAAAGAVRYPPAGSAMSDGLHVRLVELEDDSGGRIVAGILLPDEMAPWSGAPSGSRAAEEGKPLRVGGSIVPLPCVGYPRRPPLGTIRQRVADVESLDGKQFSMSHEDWHRSAAQATPKVVAALTSGLRDTARCRHRVVVPAAVQLATAAEGWSFLPTFQPERAVEGYCDRLTAVESDLVTATVAAPLPAAWGSAISPFPLRGGSPSPPTSGSPAPWNAPAATQCAGDDAYVWRPRLAEGRVEDRSVERPSNANPRRAPPPAVTTTRMTKRAPHRTHQEKHPVSNRRPDSSPPRHVRRALAAAPSPTSRGSTISEDARQWRVAAALHRTIAAGVTWDASYL